MISNGKSVEILVQYLLKKKKNLYWLEQRTSRLGSEAISSFLFCLPTPGTMKSFPLLRIGRRGANCICLLIINLVSIKGENCLHLISFYPARSYGTHCVICISQWTNSLFIKFDIFRSEEQSHRTVSKIVCFQTQLCTLSFAWERIFSLTSYSMQRNLFFCQVMSLANVNWIRLSTSSQGTKSRTKMNQQQQLSLIIRPPVKYTGNSIACI